LEVPTLTFSQLAVVSHHPPTFPTLPSDYKTDLLEVKVRVYYEWRSVGQSVLVSSTRLELTTIFSSLFWLSSDSCGFVYMGCHLWQEVGSVVYSCCLTSSAHAVSPHDTAPRRTQQEAPLSTVLLLLRVVTAVEERCLLHHCLTADDEFGDMAWHVQLLCVCMAMTTWHLLIHCAVMDVCTDPFPQNDHPCWVHSSGSHLICDMMPCSLIELHQNIRGTNRLHLQCEIVNRTNRVFLRVPTACLSYCLAHTTVGTSNLAIKASVMQR
jgi:hypothetical protein